MVCCPFPHHTDHGMNYYESNPSAGVNLSKGVFHCLSCNRAFSEIGFISQILGCTYETASRIKNEFDKNDTIEQWKEIVKLPQEIKDKILNLGISEEVIKDLDIRSEDGRSISFPVSIYGAVLDVRNYRPNERPKMRGRQNSIAGLILPYDIWRESPTNKWTLLCAGEKDMAVARSNGFNAITLTGGELTKPILINAFRDRKVAIVYDNDQAGHDGALRIAAILKEVAKEVKVVVGFHNVCTEKGEDITDFFMKYGGTREQLIHYIAQAPQFTDEDMEQEIEKSIPTMTLMEATQPKNINKTVRSNLQIVATNEASFVVPSNITVEKIGDSSPNGVIKGTKKEWNLEERTIADVLHLMDNKFTEEAVAKSLKHFAHFPADEKGLRVTRNSTETIFKCTVTDLFETSSDKTVAIEYTAYSLGKKLESGKKYKATYRLVPHPYDGQRLTMIIIKVKEATDSVTNFKITKSVIEQLNVVRKMPGTLEQRIDILINKARGLTRYDTEGILIKAIDFSYNTVLEFNFHNFEHVRGYLDTIIVSESRVGKSSTAEALQKAYSLGVFTSLAGSSATVAGIIGGSNKVNGSFQTRAGLIPQNHTGLIVFEELAKCNSQILKELTDVKSSGRARITRVNGVLDLPALVRMISLTNPRSMGGGSPRPINSYPNGIEVLTELIGEAADIARFDVMLVIPFRGTSMDDAWQLPEPLPLETYRARIRWIWSRNVHQIQFAEGVETYIIKECNKLNAEYDSHIKIFGTEAWKKVARLAIAVAGYVVSTDDSYENLIVEREHVDYAISFYKGIYDNDTFRLKEYVLAERRYETTDPDCIQTLQDLYTTASTLVLQLENSSACSRPELMAATGLPNDQFNQQLNLLIQMGFIRFQGQQIVPTLRFRRSMQQINRNTSIIRLGGVAHVPEKRLG